MAVFDRLKQVCKNPVHRLLKGERFPVLLGFLSTFFTYWLFTSAPPGISDLLDRLDNVVYDERFNIMLKPQSQAEHKIVIVDYDQKSIQAEGQWPWSRFKLGDLVSKLADYGVLVVGFDVFFPEYERNLITELEARLGPDSGNLALVSEFDNLRSLLDGDVYFAEKMQTTDVVMGLSFRPDEPLQDGMLPNPLISGIEKSVLDRINLPLMKGFVGNVDTLQRSAAGAGFFDTRPDLDGVIRRSPLIMEYEGELYPSIALEMARLYYFEDDFELDLAEDSLGLYTEIEGVRMGQILIPTDSVGRVLVPYVGPSQLGQSGSFLYVSATDVLRGTLSAEEQEALFNSLVLVGSTATGLYDLRATPLESVYPGVEVHANVLNAILRSTPIAMIEERASIEESGLNGTLSKVALDFSQDLPFPSNPDWEDGAVVVAILLIGCLLSFLYPKLGPALLLSSSLLFMVGLVFVNFLLWADYNLDISLVILLILILLITILNMTYGFVREGMSRRVIKNMFDQYVPPAHIDAMLSDPDNYNFDGESKELSVLFSDIRGFTSLSEKLSAAELKTLLNDFFTPITGVIFDNNGTIDKYVGDMVMAFWGAPIDDPDHRRHAVKAALRMLDKVEELKVDFLTRGLPEINIGIGINSGFMNVGDMGSSYRRSYTVLGDAVNLASRIESLSKFYQVNLLIGEETYEQLEGFLCRLVDRVQVKGKEQSIRIYQPLCLEEEASEELLGLVDEYARAYTQYVKQNWGEATRMFNNLKEKDPQTKIYEIYLERIASLTEQDLPVNWDGTFQHTTK